MPFIFGLALPSLFTFLSGLIPSAGMAWLFIGLSVLGPVVKKIMAFIGYGVVTYVGISLATDFLLDYLISQSQDLPADVIAIMGIMKLDVAVSLIVSAGIVRQTISGFNKALDSKRSRVWKTPNDIENPFKNGGRNF